MRKKQEYSRSVRLRWLHVQTYEIRLTNGKTILFDPQIRSPVSDDHFSRLMTIPAECGITQDTVEAADYILVNHTHVDHVVDLGYYAKKFGSMVICHNSVAYEIARAFDIPYTQIFPVGNNETYQFDDFMLQTFHGTHNSQPDFCYSLHDDPMKRMYGVEGQEILGGMGGIFNTNFLITTNENFRIAFAAGQYGPLFSTLIRSMIPYRPNLLLRHLQGRIPEHAADIYADEIRRLGVQMMMPMHHEKADSTKPEILDRMFDEINGLLEESGCTGRAFLPMRGQWYEMQVGVLAVEE